MKSIRDIGSTKNKLRNKVIMFSLALMVLVVSTSPIPSLQLIKPALAAGTLNGIAILPTNNIINTRGTYDFLFNTATTGTIKTITMSFPPGFDVSAVSRWIERSGIGSGSLSVSGQDLIYTVGNPESIPAGTTIRLEIPRIVNPGIHNNYMVTITTKDTGGSTIDGPTSSPSFPIRAIFSDDIADTTITGNDVSPSFMIRKTLKDDDVGHAHGWNPDGVTQNFVSVHDNDISTTPGSNMIQLYSSFSEPSDGCILENINEVSKSFWVFCDNFAPPNGEQLEYLITKLPSHVVTSSLSVSPSSTSSSALTISSPFSSLGEH